MGPLLYLVIGVLYFLARITKMGFDWKKDETFWVLRNPTLGDLLAIPFWPGYLVLELIKLVTR